MNNRQWKNRLKNNLCWDCNVKLLVSANYYGWECPRCEVVYAEALLTQYKRKENIVE